MHNKVYDYRNFDIDSVATFINQSGTHAPDYWPDGTIIALKNHDDDNFAIYMSNRFAIRLTGSTPYVEDKMNQLITANRVFGEGKTAPITGFTNAGVWFIGVHRTSGNNLIGFFHAESDYPGPQFEAYRSIGVTYSTDNGLNWSTPQKILAPNYPKPTEVIHSGIGDGCTIYDPIGERFICYYVFDHGIISMASSTTGAPGTWFKWDGDDFTVEGYNSGTGIGGVDTRIEGLATAAGRNPQVMWNTDVKRWVMVIGNWDGTVGMSSSVDGIVWEVPFRVTIPQNGDCVYPSLISSTGSQSGNTGIKLYHGRNTDPITVAREFVYRDMEYTLGDVVEVPEPITSQEVYEFIKGQPITINTVDTPDYIVEGEWKPMSLEFDTFSINPYSFTIDGSLTSMAPDILPVFVRYKYRGYTSEWKSVTLNAVTP